MFPSYLVAEFLVNPQVASQENLVPLNDALGPRADQRLASFNRFRPGFNRTEFSLHRRNRIRELRPLRRGGAPLLHRFLRLLPSVDHGDGLDAVVVDHVPVPVELGVGLVGALRALVFLGKIVGHCKKSLRERCVL